MSGPRVCQVFNLVGVAVAKVHVGWCVVIVAAVCWSQATTADSIPSSAEVTSATHSSAAVPVSADSGTQKYLDSTDRRLLVNQQRLMTFKSWLINRRGIYEDGFVESADDLSTTSTTLLWAGSASKLQATALKHAAQMGITATIRTVKYSRAQLEKGAKKLFAKANDSRWGSFVIYGISATDMGHDGLTIHGSYRANSFAPSPSLPSLTDTASEILTGDRRVSPSTTAQLGVQVVIDGPVLLATATRYSDTSPFNAGGLMDSNDSLSKCSSGFAIWYGGQSHTTTARHCNRTPYYTLRSNQQYGSSIATSGQGGARVLSGAGYFWMFDGTYYDSTGYHKNVVGYADLSIGDGVCTSGGMSGVHCLIKVTNLSYWLDDGYGMVQTIVATQ